MTKGELLLHAMEHIPDEAILDAEYGVSAKPRGLRKVVTVALAAALLLCMSVTVGAYVGAGDWFKDFFETLDQTLSTGQKQFIDDSAVDIGKSVTRNGYTVTLESLMMDSQRMYVKLVVEAPEDVDLKTSWCNMAADYYCVINGVEYPLTAGGHMDEKYSDRMGEANVLTVVGDYFWKLPEGVSADLQEITCGLRVNWLYITSILDHEQAWMVEGPWEFSFDLSIVEPAVELLDAPLTVSGVELRSVKLSPMGVTMVCSHHEDSFNIWNAASMRAVMRDGTAVPIFTSLGSHSSEAEFEEWYFTISPPLDMNEVAYLEFADGTMIEVP